VGWAGAVCCSQRGWGQTSRTCDVDAEMALSAQLLSRNVALGNTSAVTVPFTSSQVNTAVGLLLTNRIVIHMDEYFLANNASGRS
jgi:hypothetical protein